MPASRAGGKVWGAAERVPPHAAHCRPLAHSQVGGRVGRAHCAPGQGWGGLTWGGRGIRFRPRLEAAGSCSLPAFRLACHPLFPSLPDIRSGVSRPPLSPACSKENLATTSRTRSELRRVQSELHATKNHALSLNEKHKKVRVENALLKVRRGCAVPAACLDALGAVAPPRCSFAQSLHSRVLVFERRRKSDSWSGVTLRRHRRANARSTSLATVWQKPTERAKA